MNEHSKKKAYPIGWNLCNGFFQCRYTNPEENHIIIEDKSIFNLDNYIGFTWLTKEDLSEENKTSKKTDNNIQPW